MSIILTRGAFNCTMMSLVHLSWYFCCNVFVWSYSYSMGKITFWNTFLSLLEFHESNISSVIKSNEGLLPEEWILFLSNGIQFLVRGTIIIYVFGSVKVECHNLAAFYGLIQSLTFQVASSEIRKALINDIGISAIAHDNVLMNELTVFLREAETCTISAGDYLSWVDCLWQNCLLYDMNLLHFTGSLHHFCFLFMEF